MLEETRHHSDTDRILSCGETSLCDIWI